MPAKARKIPVTDKDLEGGGGGAFAEIDVPGDYEIVLSDVEDYDKRQKGGSWGWIFKYEVETPTGNTVEFNVFLSFGENARWKLVQVLTAHDANLSEGINEVDPNVFIGEVVAGHIDFPRNKQGEPTSKYREIQEVFKLPEAEAVEGDEIPESVEAVVAAVSDEAEEPDII